MEDTKQPYYTELKSKDDRGEFVIKIQNDCSQIRVSAANGDESIYIDVDIIALQKIRIAIDTIILENYNK